MKGEILGCGILQKFGTISKRLRSLKYKAEKIKAGMNPAFV